MSNHGGRVDAYLQGLARRERGLVLAAGVARAGLITTLAILGAELAYLWQVDRARWGAGLLLWLGLGVLLFVVVPAVRRWFHSADLRRLARRAEEVHPGWQGALIVAAERSDGARAGESAAIVDWIGQLAADSARQVPPSRVLPARGAVRAWGLWVVAVLGALGFSTWLPGGAAGALDWWAADVRAATSMVALSDGARAAPARVGDLTLRYVYPAYTGLEPYEVVNSTGEARAVPGTRVEVTARSADPVEAAAVVAYDEQSTGAEVTDGRGIRGAFTVGAAPGHWRIVTYRQGEARASKDFPILPEPDLPPEVTTESRAALLEVALDGWIEFGWTASDDFGVSRVALEVDGKIAGADLDRPPPGTRTVSEPLRRRPMDLGMLEGQTYDLVIAAWDNDTVSGNKVGRSRAIRVMVLGADGVARVSREQREEMMALLLDALADHLEELWPPGNSAADLSRWGQALSERYRPLVTFLDGFRSRRGRVARDFLPAEIAVDAGRELIRYTQVAFVPLDPEAASPAAVEEVERLRAEAIATLEDAVLSLDRLGRAEAMAEVTEAAGTLVDLAEEIDRELARDDLTAAELGYRAADLATWLKKVEAAAADTQDSAIEAFVGARAAELRALLAEVGEAARRGDLEDGRRLMARSSRSMRDMADGLRDELQRRIERAQKQQGEAKDLVEAIQELLTAQDDLAAQVGAVRDEVEADWAAALRAGWEDARARITRLERAVEAYADGLGPERPFNEREMVSMAQEELKRMQLAAELQDLPGLLNSSDQLTDVWLKYQRRYDILSSRGLMPPGTGPDAASLRGVLAEIGRVAEGAERLRRQDDAVDPAARARYQAFVGGQSELSGRLAQVRTEAKKVAQEFPVRPRGLEEALQNASDRMTQAIGNLEAGVGLQAHGSQLAASRHLREALEALMQAMQEAGRSAARMSGSQAGQPEGEEGAEEGGEGGDQEQKGEGGEEEQEGGGSDKQDGESTTNLPFELPEPEEFRTPEAYRQSLLEGMEGDVPEEYEALKRRYYEELVHQ